MSILTAISAVLKLFLLFFKRSIERDKKRKEQLKDASKEVSDGIKERNPAKITAGYDRINRL